MNEKLSLKNREGVKSAIRNRNDFVASKMRGLAVQGHFSSIHDYRNYVGNITAGALTGPMRVEFEANKPNLVYVVYSYDTPIYWIYRTGDEVFPNEFYTKTTKRHQEIVEEYWNEAN